MPKEPEPCLPRRKAVSVLTLNALLFALCALPGKKLLGITGETI